MPSVFNARQLVSPHHYEPGLIITQSQASGYFDVLSGEAPRNQLGPIDKAIYANVLDVRTQVAANQATANVLPGVSLTGHIIQAGTYTLRQRNQYSDFDVAEAGEYNVALPMAYRYGHFQGAYQYLRNIGIFGANASNSEGLINTPGATAISMPPDSFGNTTISTYDAGQMAIFLLGLINTPGATTVNLPADTYGNTTLSTYDAGQLAIWFNGLILAGLSRMFLLGTPVRVVILGPQQDLGFMQLQGVVQLTSYQRPGAGAATTAQEIVTINKEFGYTVEYAFDDTLIGQGAGGTDAILVCFPELNVPTVPGMNTNKFAEIAPNVQGNILQYTDVAAPVEVVTPVPGGLDMESTMRASAGWVIRPQAITIASVGH